MMPFSSFRMAALLTALVLTLSGCGYFQGSNADLDDEFADLDDEGKKDKAESDDGSPSDTSEITEGELELKLKVGDRFPLEKRIEQRLTQASGQGVLVNRSLTDLLLSLVVEEIRDGNTRFSVRYHRVRYGHNIAGKKVEYNSDSMDRSVPFEALAYAGLKDNGFSFWIGPNNRVVELVGFNEFLQRCLQNVPPQHRDAVLKQLQGAQSDEGLANFVDDGIGLLPYSNDPGHPAVAVKVGSVWELKPRTSEGPIPMNISTRCQLKSLSDKYAEISLIGAITGSPSPVVIQNSGQNMRLQVKGGHCTGSCTIDRRTGLPTKSEINRYVEMVVQMTDGTEIQQRKEVLTTITSYLDQGRPPEPLLGATPTAGASMFARSSGMSRPSGMGQSADIGQSSGAARASGAGTDSASSRVTPAVGVHASGSSGGQRSETPPGLSSDFESNFQRNVNR